ncbi:hypothetical protein IIC44_00720 [Patescibacteria group bacterium]|nr:hypothetical protein [Patescibacteria group bacterium]
MTLKDELVHQYFELCTDIVKKEIEKLQKKLSPKDFKAKLAKQIVVLYHGQKQADEAEKEFVRVFQKKQLPSKIKKVKRGDQGPRPLYEIIGELFAISRSEAKRVIKQGGVKIDSVIQKDPGLILKLRPKMVIQIGKRRTLQII